MVHLNKNMVFLAVLLATISISKGVNITHWSDPLTTLTHTNWTSTNGSTIVTNELCPANKTCLKLAGSSADNSSLVLIYYPDPDSNYYNWSVSMDITSIPDRTNKHILFQYICLWQMCANCTARGEHRYTQLCKESLCTWYDEGRAQYISNSTQPHNIIFGMPDCNKSPMKAELNLINYPLFLVVLRIMERYDFGNQHSSGTFINNFAIKSLEFDPETPESGGDFFNVSTCNGNIISLSNDSTRLMNTLPAEKFEEEPEEGFDVTGEQNIEILMWTAIGYAIVMMAAFIFGICKSKNTKMLFGVLFLLLQSGIDIIDVGSDIVAVGEIRNSNQKCGMTSCAMPDFQTFGTVLIVFLIIGSVLTLLEMILCIYMIVVEYGCCNQKQHVNEATTATINEATKEMETEDELKKKTQKTEDELKMSVVYVIELILTISKLIGSDIPNVITYSVLYDQSSRIYGLTLTGGVLLSYGLTCIDITYVFLMLIFKHGFFNKMCTAPQRCWSGFVSLSCCIIWGIVAGILILVLGIKQADKHTILLRYQDPSETCYGFRADEGFSADKGITHKETAIHSELEVFEWNNTRITFAINFDVNDQYVSDLNQTLSSEFESEFDQYVLSFLDFRIYYGDDLDDYDWIYCDMDFNTATNDNQFSKISNYKSFRGKDTDWMEFFDAGITDYIYIINSSLSFQMDNVDTSVMFLSDWPKGGCYSTTISCAYDFWPNCGATKIIINKAQYDFCFDICSWN